MEFNTIILKLGVEFHKYCKWVQLIIRELIKNNNYSLILQVLEQHYLNADKIAHKLLSKIAKFSFSKPNQDYTIFLSSMISLKVYLEEIKN